MLRFNTLSAKKSCVELGEENIGFFERTSDNNVWNPGKKIGRPC